MMKLFFSPASPYVRKVLVTAAECGLGDTIETVASDAMTSAPDLVAANPLSKLPTLILEDGSALFDSHVICEYLIAQSGSDRLLPAPGEHRWQILRWHALADGMLDAALNRTMERRRPAAQQSADWIARWGRNILRSADAFENEIGDLGDTVTLAHITLGCALGYLDLRHPDLDWRQGRAKLATWERGFAGRPAMRKTQPPTA